MKTRYGVLCETREIGSECEKVRHVSPFLTFSFVASSFLASPQSGDLRVGVPYRSGQAKLRSEKRKAVKCDHMRRRYALAAVKGTSDQNEYPPQPWPQHLRI